MGVKKGTQETTQEAAENQEQTTVEAPNVETAGAENGVANGPKKRGPKKGTKHGPRGPQLKWNDAREAALVETLYDLQGGTAALTIPAIMQALSQREEFSGQEHLIKDTGVKTALDRVRKQLGDEASLLPELDSNKKRVVNVSALRAIIEARKQASA